MTVNRMSWPRLIALLAAGAAALGAAGYLVVYLHRWQWQRAILCGVLLLIVLTLTFGLLILDRLSQLERRISRMDERQRQQVDQRADILAQLRHFDETEGPGTGRGGGGAGRGAEPGAGPRTRFSWLESPDDPSRHHTHVFVPILMAAGAALSGLAWLVERIARATVRPAARSRLAGRLAPLAAPPPDSPDLPDRPLPGRARQRARTLLPLVLTAALVAGTVLALAQLTRTEPPHRGDGEATSLLFRVNSKAVDEPRTELAAHQMWERCRDATSVPVTNGDLTPLGEARYHATVTPALSDHDQHRLKGCLEDTRLDRILLTVLDITALGR